MGLGDEVQTIEYAKQEFYERNLVLVIDKDMDQDQYSSMMEGVESILGGVQECRVVVLLFDFNVQILGVDNYFTSYCFGFDLDLTQLGRKLKDILNFVVLSDTDLVKQMLPD